MTAPVNGSPGPPVHGMYAIRLHPPDAADPGRVASRLEHVFSGRCHDFDSAEALIGWLRHERRRDALVQAYREAPAPPE